MTERVDRRWLEQGLGSASTEAILGTLAHYGVALDEDGFRALAERDFPLGIADAWQARWKGTGPFRTFPPAAADELWRRLCPGRVVPADVALAAYKLVRALGAVADGEANVDEALDARFRVLEAYLPAIPQAPEVQRRFLDELETALASFQAELDVVAEDLARVGQRPLAARFAALEEALIPVRTGVVLARVRAAAGEVAEAVADLEALAADPGRSDPAQLQVVDAFLALERPEAAKALALTLLGRAEAKKDVELAAGVVERLTELLREHPGLEGKEELRKRVEGLARALGGGA